MPTLVNPLIQIVPSLPPSIDGIGDYALVLARQLRMQAGIETTFIVCDPGWRRDLWSGEFEAVRLGKRSDKRMLEEILLLMAHERRSGSQILLHCSPYGYQKRGCPVWLVRALETADERLGGRLNTAFHELDVEGARIFSSAFWVPGLQRHLLGRLLRLSQFAYTNTGLHRSKLQAWGHREISLIPNFSNIGESDEPLPQHRRERNVVIFGRADQRRWTYTHGTQALAKVCAAIEADQIIDVGAPIPEHTCERIDGTRVVRRGLLPADEVAAIMRSSLASFAYYPVPLLTKSGVHALACASGTIPFVCSDVKFGTTCAGLTAGLDYVLVNGSDDLPFVESLERLASAIHASYGKRTSKIAAQTVADNIYGSARTSPHLVAPIESRFPASSTFSLSGRAPQPVELERREVVL